MGVKPKRHVCDDAYLQTALVELLTKPSSLVTSSLNAKGAADVAKRVNYDGQGKMPHARMS